jgi:hypothetical protein
MMNAKINQLVETAVRAACAEIPTKDPEPGQIRQATEWEMLQRARLSMFKAVELAVQEAVAVCLEQRDPGNLNYKPSEKFAAAINQHFGVE